MTRLTLWAVCVLGAGLLACGSEPTTVDEQARLEKEFQESMTDVALVGNFTVSGRGDDAKLRPERYEVKSVNHVAGDIWTFTTRIQYGDHDVTVPVPVKLLWAGDTPVATLTDAAIPGLGTFTARVVFFRDRYSGMWQHGETGGNQFGRILRGAEAQAE